MLGKIFTYDFIIAVCCIGFLGGTVSVAIGYLLLEGMAHMLIGVGCMLCIAALIAFLRYVDP